MYKHAIRPQVKNPDYSLDLLIGKVICFRMHINLHKH